MNANICGISQCWLAAFSRKRCERREALCLGGGGHGGGGGGLERSDLMCHLASGALLARFPREQTANAARCQTQYVFWVVYISTHMQSDGNHILTILTSTYNYSGPNITKHNLTFNITKYLNILLKFQTV